MNIIDKDKEIKSNSDVYEIYLGTFIDNAFTWYSIKKFKDLTEAYKEYKKYVNTQLKYTDEELQQVWDTGRLDIELRQGNKLLNWVGIYSREVKDLSKEEEEEAEEGKTKKDSVDLVKRVETCIDNSDFSFAYNSVEVKDLLGSTRVKLHCELDVLDYPSLVDYNEEYEDIDINKTELDKFVKDTLNLKSLGDVTIEDYDVIETEVEPTKYNWKQEDLRGKFILDVEVSIEPIIKDESDNYFITFRYEDSFKWTAGETEFIETLGFKDEDLEFDHIPTQDEIDTRFSGFLDEMFKRDTQDPDIEDGTEITGSFSKIKLYSESDDEMKEIKEYKPIDFNYIITK